MLCFAHRGARGHEPENTLLSIAKALELGTDWIEIDVYAVEDFLIVIHDDRLERTTNGIGKLSDRPLAYLRSLDAGKGQQIPLLDEVFDLVDRRAGVNIELKGPDTADLAAAFIKDRIGQGWTYDQILVSSFDHGQLQRVKELNPEVRLGALLGDDQVTCAELERTLQPYSVHPAVEAITPVLVQEAHECGMKVFAFTANTAEEVARLRLLEIDGVFTDFPELVLPPSALAG